MTAVPHLIWTPAVRRARSRWGNMVARCTKPSAAGWHNYGGRGIAVCDRWLNSFDDYYADVGDAPPGRSLDRVDNDGNYEPSNVRWATPAEQTANRRDFPRRTHCPQGHPYDEANTWINPKRTTVRNCRKCRAASTRRYYARRRAA